METMEQRGLESISHRAEKLLKMLKTVKPYLGAQPHNPEVAGSSPVSATIKVPKSLDLRTFFAFTLK